METATVEQLKKQFEALDLQWKAQYAHVQRLGELFRQQATDDQSTWGSLPGDMVNGFDALDGITKRMQRLAYRMKALKAQAGSAV